MSIGIKSLLGVALLCGVGCGGGDPPLNMTPLTEEQKAQIKAQDQEVDDAERSGSGTATPAKKRR